MAIVAADDADDEKLACVDQAKRCVLQDFGDRQTLPRERERDLRKLSKINEIFLENQQVCESLLPALEWFKLAGKRIDCQGKRGK